VRLPEGTHDGRVQVFLGFYVQMVSPVVRRPPERPLLVGGRPREGEQELEGPTGPVRAVGEEAVESRGDGEHAHGVERQADGDRRRARARPEREEAGQVYEEELRADAVVQIPPAGPGAISRYSFFHSPRPASLNSSPSRFERRTRPLPYWDAARAVETGPAPSLSTPVGDAPAVTLTHPARVGLRAGTLRPRRLFSCLDSPRLLPRAGTPGACYSESEKVPPVCPEQKLAEVAAPQTLGVG